VSGAAIVLTLEQGKLAALLGAPRLKPPLAQFDDARPAEGALVELLS
jgi:hypothetical protein